MVVIAGPAGGGKSTAFPPAQLNAEGYRYFNIDLRCRELNSGSSHNIAPEIRAQANRELKAFCEESIEARMNFAFETTLRRDFALRMTTQAKSAGYRTEMRFIALESAELHVRRVTGRSLAGGHSAPPSMVQEIYRESIDNLRRAIRMTEFDYLRVLDNTGADLKPLALFGSGRLLRTWNVPPWLAALLDDT